ncbi:MAG: secretion protein [Planctomycetes bacterium RBG_16_64_10]|nr:MAG: secretion protein [Planctomycetes bacterium RBG_16_64_10]
MTSLIIMMAAFVGVAALVGSVALMLRGDTDSELEQRLDILTGASLAKGAGKMPKNLVLTSPLDSGTSMVEALLARLGNVRRLFQQADTTLSPTKFVAISAGLGFAASSAFALAGIHPALIPLMAVLAALVPLAWLLLRRRKRLRTFAAQLPDALELMSRALRAGHSLASGFNLVAREMVNPIAKEFGRVFEEQNLGIPLDEALESMTERIPNLDLRFFATAVVLQRQTGGDLAEILDKISRLIRERFALWGQVQALTGEGRLSGAVLLALPPFLFVVVWRLNPDYIVPLFTDPLGKKMLIGGVVMQLLGALAIRKIVNIKV